MLARQEFWIAAKKNVRAATGHVRGDGNGALAARLRDDSRFTLVLLGVQDLMRNAPFFNRSAMASDFSMEIVPTSTGWPRS